MAGVDGVHGFSNYVSHNYKKVFCVSGLLSFPQCKSTWGDWELGKNVKVQKFKKSAWLTQIFNGNNHFLFLFFLFLPSYISMEARFRHKNKKTQKYP